MSKTTATRVALIDTVIPWFDAAEDTTVAAESYNHRGCPTATILHWFTDGSGSIPIAGTGSLTDVAAETAQVRTCSGVGATAAPPPAVGIGSSHSTPCSQGPLQVSVDESPEFAEPPCRPLAPPDPEV
ncbi:hypothetical protein [Acidipropionibacterium jensenii]|uniref:hypothetical protein n=1 Tax=Acidipropionibacterium jensenii TaxID=1749 RepID=UPI00214AE4C2|nr:hypothetical protein [Acidipropionibacterium jensenii]